MTRLVIVAGRAGAQAYLRWFREFRLAVWHRFVPEGSTGRGLMLATAS